MYRLRILVGPNKGKSIPLEDGHNTIGRSPGSDVTLASSKVSKQHCSVIVMEDSVLLQDLNSSNGTFVNGSRVMERPLKVGDRVSVGEYVLELAPFESNNPYHAALVVGKDKPEQEVKHLLNEKLKKPHKSAPISEKLIWYAEKFVMPYFYQLNKKYEWKTISLSIFFIFTGVAVVGSAIPLLTSNRQSIIDGATRRARLIARQIVEENSAFVANDEETKTKIGIISRSRGVKLAVLMTLDGRILAPPENFNQNLVAGKEALFASKISKLYREGKLSTGQGVDFRDNLVIAVEPLLLLDPNMGKNVVAGMALVSIDASTHVPSFSDTVIVIFSNFIVFAIIGLLFLYFFYRLTMRRFEIINYQIDQVLRGEVSEIKTPLKFQELKSLESAVNSSVQRLARTSLESEDGLLLGDGTANEIRFEDLTDMFRILSANSEAAIVALDESHEMTFANDKFEQITGIHVDEEHRRKLVDASRDQAFSALVADLFEQLVGTNLVRDEFEFSGTNYKVECVAIGGGASKGYILVLSKELEDYLDEAI